MDNYQSFYATIPTKAFLETTNDQSVSLYSVARIGKIMGHLGLDLSMNAKRIVSHCTRELLVTQNVNSIAGLMMKCTIILFLMTLQPFGRHGVTASNVICNLLRTFLGTRICIDLFPETKDENSWSKPDVSC